MFGESINVANSSRITILVIFSGLITFYVKDIIQYNYFAAVGGVFVGGVLLGELTRRIFRLFIKEKTPNSRIEIRDRPLSKEREKQRDIEALNCGIGWYVVICFWLYF